MPSHVTPQKLGQAVLEHVQSGAYPESEEIISADLPSSALPEISKLIDQAKQDVKSNIRKASKDSAPDIDGWISQAKQLRVDIQECQRIAREIVEQAQQGECLEGKVNDAISKVDLLNGEILFNSDLRATLERLQAIQETLELVQRATFDDRLVEAVELLERAKGHSKSLSLTKSTRLSGVFEANITDLRNRIKERLIDHWYRHIIVDSVRSSIQVSRETEGSSAIDLDSVVIALADLHSYDDVSQHFCLQLESNILLPRLTIRPNGCVSLLEINDDEILATGQSSDLSVQALFHDLNSVMDFLHARLPPSAHEPITKILMPRLVSRLISTWLASAVPDDLDGMEDFEDTVVLVKQFGENLDTYNWSGARELTEWIEGIPSVWLRKRRETALDQVRKLLSRKVDSIQKVERVETQVISGNDKVFASNGGDDDWNAGWSDEDTSPTVTKDPSVHSKTARDQDEEDVSAWGLNNDKGAEAVQPGPNPSDVADEDGEAWGWGDEEEEEEATESPLATTPSPKKPSANGIQQTAQQAEREVTLRETYNITSLPTDILEIINQVISDVDRLEKTHHASIPISSTASDLFSLPGLVLAMYRASSSIGYSRHSSGQMFLYNDSLWLAERLRDLDPDRNTASGKEIPSRMAYNLKLHEHASAVESFGKRAYTKERESQRIILIDLLDGAQGFVNCAEHPFTGESDLAIASTVNRLRYLHKEWKDVLSHSALLQSLGFLLSAVIKEMIGDIEDMSDISEAESQQLTTFCNRITTLEDLFLPTQETPHQAQSREVIPVTPLYTPHWLKFQYLANILESSLIDIKYLWLEGELSLEFDTEEVVDLIEALFADSPHRRTALAEIRRKRGVR